MNTEHHIGRPIETDQRGHAILLSAAPPLVPRDSEEPPALSFMQRRLWLLDQWEHGSSLHVICGTARLAGKMDLRALYQSLQQIVRRHDALRTTFRDSALQPIQVIASQLTIPLPLIDLSGLPETERKRHVALLAAPEAQQPFDLANGPLLRAALLRLTAAEQVLVLHLHQSIADNRSLSLLGRELDSLYSAALRGEPANLPALPLQYADYASWQHRCLQAGIMDQQLAYWREQLAGAPELLTLPLDEPRPAVLDYRQGLVGFQVPPELWQALGQFCEREELTPFMVLLAAWQLLLARLNGQNDSVVGTMLLDRPRPELRDLIGCFTNIQPLRASLDDNPTVRELLDRVRIACLEAGAYADLPFELLMEEIHPEPILDHTPIVQTLLVLQRATTEEIGSKTIELRPTQPLAEPNSVRCDVALYLTEQGATLQGNVAYNATLFKEETIQQTIGRWLQLLKALLHNTERKLSELDWLLEGEREQILLMGQGPRVTFPLRTTVPEMVEAQAARTPEAIALQAPEGCLSYEALNRLANQVATTLLALGHREREPIGLFMPSSLLAAVGLLGILKAGGVYLPLDPSLPEERLLWLVEQTGLRQVLTLDALRTRVQATSAQPLCLDHQWEQIRRQPDDGPLPWLFPEDLAYIIYTSGSTGRPKGVMVPHRAILNRIWWGIDDCQLQPADRQAELATWSFDIAFYELCAPWLAGATTVLVPSEIVRDSDALLTYLDQQQATIVHVVPSLLNVLVQEPELRILRSVRCLLCGGEALSAQVVSRWFAALPIEVHQLYGPTEAAISTTCWQGRPETWKERISLGGPIANTQIYLLDAWQQPVPPGVQGEIYLGGQCLARGYRGRPDLTAERFVPDPFSEIPGAVLYRTGDMARWLSGWEVEFVGRVDHQVKIRGHRIEPGEIAAQVQSYPGIRESIVVVRKNQRGELQLVAYVVAAEQSLLQIEELRQYLQGRLPEYMVPSAFVELKELPLTVNRKVDRRALPEPEQRGGWQKEGYVAPRSPVEQRLATIWQEMLQVEQVGVRDNFFALGGHSLLGSRLMARVRETFHVNLSLQALFEAPTITTFTSRLSSASTPDRAPMRLSPDMAVQASFAQERLWFLDQLEGGSAFYHIAHAIAWHRDLGVETVQESINQIIARHEALRTSFQVQEGRPVQIIAPTLRLSLPLVDLSGVHEAEAELKRCTLAEVSRPFVLTQVPLLRALLLKLGKREFVLLLIVHHLVADGWSLACFTRELLAFMEAARTGERAAVPELPLQYREYAAWERDYLSAQHVDQQLAYWRRQLADAPALLELPLDHPRPAVQRYQGARRTFALSERLTRGLRALSRQEEVTLYMTLLGAFAVLLMRYSGQRDIVVGTPAAGRNRREWEALIGLFVNTLAMRLRVEGEPTFRQMLEQVKRVAQEAYAYQEVPWEQVVEAVYPQRSLSYNPVFQACFAWEEEFFGDEHQRQQGMEPLRLETGFTTFDLTLYAWEEGKRLEGMWEYRTDLFEPETIERWQRSLESLLEGIAAHPDEQINALPLAREDEQQRRRWAVGETPEPDSQTDERSIVAQFEAQVRRNPQGIALCAGDHMLTYQQVEERANRLARVLRERGVGEELRVGLYLERSLELLVAMVAVLKAGGAYMPLDPDLPEERLTFMIEDAEAGVVLTQRSLEGRLTSPGKEVQVLCLDREWQAIASRSAEPLQERISPEQLAYVIYTSGSTGRPKGVGIAHRHLSNLVAWHQRAFALTEADRATHLAGLGFDASVWEVWPNLLAGAELWLVEEDVRSDPARLQRWLIARAITQSFAPTPLAEQLVALSWPESTPLRYLLAGGDALHPVTLTTVPFTLINNYGPTECTVVATSGAVQEARIAGQSPDIGRPIAGTQVYVLDDALRETPPGAIGELYIGGASVGRGYIKRPELTAERFLPDAFGEHVGARMYRTGDLVRWRNDGTLEFVGRADQQVKIRGFRIEPGEIEALLRRHPGVREGLVLAREDLPGEKRLVAYLVPDAGIALDQHELAASLQERLPAYMLPTAYVVLEAFPLHESGKINRRALPVPDYRASDHETFVAPRTPTEEAIARIWMEVLHIAELGIYDNFFNLGGHSLLATRIMTRVSEAFQRDIPLRVLFGSPTVAGLSQYLDDLRLSVPIAGAGPAPTALSRQPRAGQLPLSFAQERLWFLDQLSAGSPQYIIPFVLRLRGELDSAVLEQGLNDLVRRHESLRTTFGIWHNHPVQRISEPSARSLPVFDLSALPEAARQIETQHLIHQEARTPFDLQRGPLLRLHLLRLAPLEHMLLFTMHHIVTDGWSHNILIAELHQSYSAGVQGITLALADPPLQYVDYALWQRAWLQAGEMQRQLAYWKQRLAGAPTLEMPTDWPRPAVQGHQGANYFFSLSTTLTTRLHELGQREGVTLYVTMLSAFLTLLCRYTEQTDLVVGMPVAGRPRSELEEIVGFFVNTLALRCDLSGKPSFRELLHRVQQHTLESYAYQDVPFERVVEALQPERSLSHHPLFQVIFDVQAEPFVPRLGTLTVERQMVVTDTAKFDLSLQFEDDGITLQGILEYNLDLFVESTIKRLVNNLQTLLESAVADPTCSIVNLPILAPEEQRALLTELNATRTAYPEEQGIVALFHAQVERTPDAVAVVGEADEFLTYRALSQRANPLAHYLQAQGIGPEVRVGIFAERSLSLLIAVLAILKAGGSYAPFATSFPPERLAFLLEDAHINILLTQEESLPALPAWDGLVFCLNRDRPSLDRFSHADPSQKITPDTLAYVISTSGSTGLPKSVAIPQRGVTRLVLNTNYIQIEPDDVVAHLSQTSFDAATFEIWGALLNGARVLIIPREVALLPEALEQRLRLHHGNTIFLTTALFNQIAHLNPQFYSRMRYVLFGGEMVDPQAVRSVLRHYAPEHLLHVYGPTENTTFSTFFELHEVMDTTLNVPIGRPIANTSAYVLDAEMRAVPFGVVGELYLGGDGLARGYLGRPELSAVSFVPHPFSEVPGARLYKTGDLVRQHPQGEFDFIGRVDQQVKIRGFRIEPGEIEAILSAHPAVQENIVLARRKATGDIHLVAYLVPAADDAPTSAGLRQFLLERLPDYMVPTAFVSLPTLPLNPHGKVDQAALLARDWDVQEHEQVYEEPRTPIERQLAAIWQALLQIQQVGLHDDFFALGGHSLLMTQAISRIRETFQITIPVQMMFEASTIAELARYLEQEIAGQQPETRELESNIAHIPLLQRGSAALGELTFPLSFAQQRLWLLDQLDPGNPSYNIAAAVRFEGPLEVHTLAKGVQMLVDRHESLRTTFATAQGAPVQIVAPSLLLALPIVDLSVLPEGAREACVQNAAIAEARHSFDLTRGPLIRTTLLRKSATEHILLVNTHHSISDGWSFGIFLRELSQGYAAMLAGQSPALPALPLQYADYASWQRNWLQGEPLDTLLHYWQQHLSGAPPVLELPLDHPRPALQSYRGGIVSSRLPLALTERLKGLSQREGATLFMSMLSFFLILLGRYSGRTDLVVGTPIANRNRADIEGLIGFFVNTLVLRADLTDDPDIHTLLQRVKAVTLGAYAHQDIPFDKLLEELNPERSLSHPPLFQVFFNMANLPAEQNTWPDLKVETFWPREIGSKFDMTLFTQEDADGMQLELIYNSDLFEHARMVEMLTQYRGLIQQALEQDRPIARYTLVTPRAQHLLPDPTAELSARWEGPVHRLFSQQALRLPQQVALVDDLNTIRYAELEMRSNQVAHYLRAQGIASQEVVAIAAQRSAALIWAILGIFKAGATALILDPAYPTARLLDYMQRAHVRGWLQIEGVALDPELETRVAEQTRCHLTLARRFAEAGTLADYPMTAPAIEVGPDNVACLTFTSGSTGTPKGVLQRHGPLTHFLPWMHERFALLETDRYSLLSGLAHDPLQREIFTPLCLGARICIPAQERMGDPGWLARWMQQQEISIGSFTPALIQLLTQGAGEDALPDARISSLRYAFVVGEALTRRHVTQLYQVAPKVTCVNFYGSTETQRAVGYYMLPAAPAFQGDVLPAREVIPLGKGIPDVQILLLNQEGEMAGVGELGEVYVRSPHLARGYLDDPPQTQKRFVLNPFTGKEGDRLYRTGDLGRYLPDGNAEFAGRNDLQVKIRGYRIELEEIEAVLVTHPEVREAIVVARDDARGNKQLVAYMVTLPSIQEPFDMSALRAFVAQRLPAYMLPAIFAPLERLPLTANGKIDRQALPDPDPSALQSTALVQPRTPVEANLAQMWSTLLGRELAQIGITANFFELGGHSLLATRLLARINETFQVTLTLRTLFEAPTIEGLATAIERDKARNLPPPMEEPILRPLSRSAYRRSASSRPTPN